MTQKYKLKKDARKFFDEKHHESIYELKTWRDLDIPIQVLDEVDAVYIDYGHEYKLSTGTKASSLSGWRGEDSEAHFNFTIKVTDIDNIEYNKTDIPELMDALQKTANSFFKYL